MIEIDNALVSMEVLSEQFVCDLGKCKGTCCIEGDGGAPVEANEMKILDEIYPIIEPYLRQEGREAIRQQGKYIRDWDGEMVTPLVNGKECAYVIFENGVAKCAIEQAHRDGKTGFKKPVSCHLYPIRITKYARFEAVNYHRWDICDPARECGSKLKVKVFRFLKEAIVRKYGQAWYDALEAADKELSV